MGTFISYYSSFNLMININYSLTYAPFFIQIMYFYMKIVDHKIVKGENMNEKMFCILFKTVLNIPFILQL